MDNYFWHSKFSPIFYSPNISYKIINYCRKKWLRHSLFYKNSRGPQSAIMNINYRNIYWLLVSRQSFCRSSASAITCGTWRCVIVKGADGGILSYCFSLVIKEIVDEICWRLSTIHPTNTVSTMLRIAFTIGGNR